MDLREFGLYFAKLREESGFRSQRELADKSGVSHSTINRIEAGKHKVSTENLKILSKYLKGVDYEDLMSAAGYLDSATEAEESPKQKGFFAFYGGGDDWTDEEKEMARLAAEAAVEAMRKRKEKEKK
jgi:transcriptional regulator with XRE-family HTH domain